MERWTHSLDDEVSGYWMRYYDIQAVLEGEAKNKRAAPKTRKPASGRPGAKKRTGGRR